MKKRTYKYVEQNDEVFEVMGDRYSESLTGLRTTHLLNEQQERIQELEDLVESLRGDNTSLQMWFSNELVKLFKKSFEYDRAIAEMTSVAVKTPMQVPPPKTSYSDLKEKKPVSSS